MVDEPGVTQPAAPQAPAPAVKPGYATTEFWLHTLVTVLGIVMAALPSSSKIVQVAGMALSLLSALGYTAGRVSVKNAAMLFVLCTLALGMGACCSIDRKTLQDEATTETMFMTELSAYVNADPAKSADTKAAENLLIQAHLKRFNSLNATMPAAVPPAAPPK